MKKSISLMVVLTTSVLTAEVFSSARSPLFKYNTTGRHDITVTDNDQVNYDSAWIAGGTSMKLYRGNDLLVELTGAGTYDVSYVGIGTFGALPPLKLETLDGNGNVIDTQRARYFRYKCAEEQAPQVPSEVKIISSKVRDSDPTIIDTVYRVSSKSATCDTRILAFEDGMRSFAKILRPTTFVDGTEANLGDGVPANQDLTVSWKASSDWEVDLAKVKIEILVKKDRLLPLGFFRLKDPSTQKEYLLAKNTPTEAEVFDALLWLYADNTAGLTVASGYLKNGSTILANGANVSSYSAAATQYCIRKMGYEPLPASGELRDLVNSALRTTLTPSGFNQWSYREL